MSSPSTTVGRPRPERRKARPSTTAPPPRTPSYEEQLYLLSPEARSPVWETGYSVREFLERTHRDAREINRYFIEQQCRGLMIQLVQVRRLPSFYFREEARRNGIGPEVYRRWRTSEWPPRDLGTEHEILEITMVLMEVFKRLRSFQDPTTYGEALDLAVERLGDAMKDGMSRNALSQKVRIRNQALQSLLDPASPRRTPKNMCPWDILRRLDEQDADTQNPGVHPLQALRILNALESNQSPTDRLPQLANQIEAGGSCHHCGEPWAAQRFESAGWIAERPWNIHICLPCGRENLVAPPGGQEMYGPCVHCGAPYHQMRGTPRDAAGRVVKTCLACGQSALMDLGVYG